MDVVAELERPRVEGEADGAGEHDDELQGDVHPRAQLAAEAAEAAADQGAFWDMHDILLEHQDLLGPSYLVRNAEQLGIDVEWFTNHCRTTPALPASPKTLTAPT